MNETDLHYRVVAYLRRFHPCVMIVGVEPPWMGEIQGTGSKRQDAYRKGYAGGQPDIILANFHTNYSCFAIELKTPKGPEKLSENQSKPLEDYAANGHKTLVSNDYDFVLREIEDYVRGVRIRCPSCRRLFKTKNSLSRHMRWIHRLGGKLAQ